MEVLEKEMARRLDVRVEFSHTTASADVCPFPLTSTGLSVRQLANCESPSFLLLTLLTQLPVVFGLDHHGNLL